VLAHKSLARNISTDSGNAAALVFFLFGLLYLDGEDVSARPLVERKTRLAALLANVSSPLHYSDHQRGQGRAFHEKACAMSLEGIVSKRADAPYASGNRGLWLKVKCLDREEFVVIGWTDPEGSRPWLGALLLACYDPDGRLVYAGRAGAGSDDDRERQTEQTIVGLPARKFQPDRMDARSWFGMTFAKESPAWCARAARVFGRLPPCTRSRPCLAGDRKPLPNTDIRRSR
jgi:ATP-dependent DNA ligase